MKHKNEWEELFDEHAPFYMKNPFTKDSVREVEFVLEELNLLPGSRILDVGCGTGRHAVELAKRGYKVMGLDISSGMLTQAKKAARKAKVEAKWIHADAAEFVSDELFDAAISLCEGAFGLLGANDDSTEHDLRILQNVNAAIKPNGRFIVTALNGFRMIRQYSQKDVDDGTFNPNTMVEACHEDYDTAQGKKRRRMRERGYTPTELQLLFRSAEFEVEHIWGGTAGSWKRGRIDLEEIEVMVIGRKTVGKT